MLTTKKKKKVKEEWIQKNIIKSKVLIPAIDLQKHTAWTDSFAIIYLESLPPCPPSRSARSNFKTATLPTFLLLGFAGWSRLAMQYCPVSAFN